MSLDLISFMIVRAEVASPQWTNTGLTLHRGGPKYPEFAAWGQYESLGLAWVLFYSRGMFYFAVETDMTVSPHHLLIKDKIRPSKSSICKTRNCFP